MSAIEEVSQFGAQDKNWLLDPVENPTKPNAKLKAGKKKRYKKPSETTPVLPSIGSHDRQGFDSGARTDRLLALTQRAVR